MTICKKCNKEIPNGDIFATLDYNIEMMNLSPEGLSVQVVSSETIHTMCKACAIEMDPGKMNDFLKNIVGQDGAGN